MKSVLTILMLVLAVAVCSQVVTVSWVTSPSPDIASYRIYFGEASRNYLFVTNCGLNTTQTVVLPHPGRWFFAATASDASGLESPFSNEAEWEAKPEPPLMQGEVWVRLTPVIECSTNLVDWRGVEGVPTWVSATNRQEFFMTRRLLIERVQRIEGQ